jgi:outer membrane protein OmpA-like peptidoglycan-associated protein
MKKLSILLFTMIALNGIAQNVEFEKKNFPGRKDELNEAKDNIKKGDEIFEQGEAYYRDALPFYLKAQNFNPNNAKLNFKIGLCYLHSFEKKKAYDYILKAFQLDPSIDPKIRYYMGRVYHLNSEWDKAIQEYSAYLNTIKSKEEIKDVNKKIQECNSGKILSQNPIRVWVDNLGPEVNTSFNEYSPVITADESVLMFTSRRPGGVGNKMDESKNEYFEDVWVSYKVGKKFSQAVNLGPPVNTENHDAAVCLSPDGQKLITYQGGVNGGDLFISYLVGKQWSKPENLGKAINTKYHESSASFSYDGKILYFVSDREGGYGGHDIYYAEINEKGKFEKAVNIGPVINTEYNEEAVFMMPDGKTMYFASEGHNSIGGYDIFKTTFENGQWTKPVNLGIPINTPDDDVFFALAGSGRRAYYSSASQGGYGGMDLYKITILGPEKQPLLNTEDQLLAMSAKPVTNLKVEQAVEVTKPKMTLLKGIVYDNKTNEPLEAILNLIDNEKNVILASFKSNAATGKYLVTLPSGKNYGIAVQREGYLFHSENFNLPADADYQEVTKDIPLKKIEIGNTIVLKNIFFDFDKATLRPESFNELDRLVKLLTENPTIKVELSAHTDSKGSDEYNMKLSQKRAESVVNYLIGKGISADRLIAKGYGETQPIDTNDTEEGRQNNRRVEFKILSAK